MKTVYLLLFALLYTSSLYSQISFPLIEDGGDTAVRQRLFKFLYSNADKKNKQIIYRVPESRVEFTGLGNISSSETGEGLSPSANVFTRILPIRLYPEARLYLGFNLGAELDSTGVDSIKFGRLFLPERGKSGYVIRAEYDLLSQWAGSRTEDETKHKLRTELSPFIEYNYNKINIKDVHEDSSKIETSTWVFGVNLVQTIIRNKNDVAIQLTPFYKRVIVTDGTMGTYKQIFKGYLKDVSQPQRINFIGLILGLQINRFQFSFIVDDLKNKDMKNTQIYGGVYTLRGTVIGDFIKL